MAMLSFIVVPSLMQLIPQTGSRVPTDLAACRAFGNVNERSLYALQQNRQGLVGFFSNLLHILAQQHGETHESLRNLAVLCNQLSNRMDNEDLINEWLLVQYAQKKMGITVNDQEIDDFLKQLTHGLASDTANNNAMSYAGMNPAMLKARLREYLIAVKVDKMFSFHDGFQLNQDPVSPLTRWDWFQRMRRSVTAEVAAIPVERFAAEVADPSERELQKFFDDNKSRMFHPSSPESGFMQPEKIAFQFIKIVPSKDMLDSISKEEIEKFYEENKIKLFRKPITPIGQQLGGPPQPGAIPFPTLFNTTPLRRSDDVIQGEVDEPLESKGEPAESSKPEEMPAETPPPEEKPAETPSTEEKPAEMPSTEEKPTEMPSTEEKPAETPASEEKPAETPAPEEKPAEMPKPEEKSEEMEEMSFLRAMPTTRPVSFLDETPMVEAKPGEDTLADPGNMPIILEPPTTTPELPILAPPTTTPAAPGAGIDLAILFKPLTEVEDEIRRMLVQRPLDDAIEAINATMREYSKAFYKKDAMPKPDLKALADQYGLEFFETPMVAFTEAQRFDFARGIKERQFLARLFASTPVLFDPQTIDGDTNQYLFWSTDSQAKKEPQSLEEVRPAVLSRWKEVQARPLALKHAEELAERTRKPGISLADAFADQGDVKIVETEPFTWDSIYAIFYIQQGYPPPLGEVREKGVADGNAEIDNTLIVAPGENFMEIAYGLAVDEVGVAMNQPETVVYVIRVTESSPPVEELRQSFQSMKFNPYLYIGRQAEMIREAREARLKRIQDEVGFKWINKPERR